MRRSTSPVGPLIAIAIACAGVLPAFAGDLAPGELRGSVDGSAWDFLYSQDSTVHAEDLPAPTAPVAGLDGNTPEKPLTDEERARLADALLLAPNDLGIAGAKSVRRRGTSIAKPSDLEVTRNQQSGGVSTVVFNKPIAPAAGEWKAKIGADLGMAADGNANAARDPLRVQRDTRGANAAWASVDVHEIATVDARVNPGSDQGMVATTFKRSMPIGSHLSMTLQSRTSVTETFGRSTTAQTDIPMAALPAADGTTAQRSWGQENSARLNILSTGTTFGAGVSSSSTDTITHNTLTAEQQLYGPVSVSTALNDVGQTWQSKSVSARAKFKW